MNSGELFAQIFENLKVKNYEEIARRRDEIAKALNEEYRGLDGSTKYQLMVGSYGRHTAINGISDLDMLYILPANQRNKYRSPDGPSKALARTRKAILERYSNTEVKVRQLVVVVQFENFKFEVQPVFAEKNGDFSYPDTKLKLWRKTKPKKEIEAAKNADEETSGKYRKLCRLARAWKNKHQVNLNGLLIDTLAFNFLKQYEPASDEVGNDYMLRDFFNWLSLEPRKAYYMALGSNQKVYVKQHFQKKAQVAHRLAEEAIDAENETLYAKKWRNLLGKPVPLADDKEREVQEDPIFSEQFIEDLYYQNIRYTLDIDCSVTDAEGAHSWLSTYLRRSFRLPRERKLLFEVTYCDVPKPYEIKWKVLNQGEEAKARNMIRGQILDDEGQNKRKESTDFRGDHYVECYAIKDNEVVARAHITVPID